MSAYNASSTYQSIVIAIVAGGIVSAGVMSIVWRRRARRRWMEARRRLPPGGDERMSGWMDGWDVGGGIGGRGRGGGGVGKEPGIWDVVLAGQGQREEQGREKIQEKQPDVEDEQETPTNTPNSDGQHLLNWKPTSLSLSLSPKTPTKPAFASPLARPSPPVIPPSHLAQITVLVAMPDPDAPGSSRRQSTPAYDALDDEYRYVSRAEGDYDEAERDDYLPSLEIGSSSITIQTDSNEGDRGGGVDILEELFKNAQSERKDDNRKRGDRERTDDPWSDIPLGEATRDPLASPSAAARFAVIRYGALSGFAGQGQTRTSRSSSSHPPGPPPSSGGA